MKNLKWIASVILLVFSFQNLAAQSIKVFKSDNTVITIPLTELDSIVAYGEEDVQFVDLGLSVKWGAQNIGATSPEDYGDYFAWGEVSTKNSYSDTNSLTYGKQMGNIAGDTKHDAATASLGRPARIPTLDELNELVANCTTEWCVQNGVYGRLVTSRINGNSIFFPNTGYKEGSSLYDDGQTGFFWTITSYEEHDYSSYVLCSKFDYFDWRYEPRYLGMTIRPVQDNGGEVVMKPYAKTAEVNEVTENSATVYATFGNVPENASCGIEYSDGSTTSEQEVEFVQNGSYSVTLSNLSSSTIYSYRAYVKWNGGAVYGNYREFITSDVKKDPVAVTGEAVSITETSAWIYANFENVPEGAYCGVEYVNLSTGEKSNQQMSQSDGTYSVQLMMLQPGTTYRYYAYVRYDGGESYGESREFTTLSTQTEPVAITGEITDITETSAWVSATFKDVPSWAFCGVEYVNLSTGRRSNHQMSQSDGEYSVQLMMLQPGTTYRYYAYVRYDGGEIYGESKEFTTLGGTEDNETQWVDLGLSVKWASCNLGANNPEDAGDYFAWGEIATKSYYSEENYQNPYQTHISGNAQYDAAVAIAGDGARMPTIAEYEELVNNCTAQWTYKTKAWGCEMTSRINGKSIFFPAAGYYYQDRNKGAGRWGSYWSGDLSENGLSPCNFAVDEEDGASCGTNSRALGLSIRPVHE